MNRNIATKAAQYVQLSGALVKRALDELEPLKKDAEKAAAESQNLVAALMAAEMIDESSKEAAAKLIGSRTGLQTLLKQAAEVVKKLAGNQKEAAELGQAVDPKTAGLREDYNSENASLTSPFVGLQTSEKKASDIAYERALLGR